MRGALRAVVSVLLACLAVSADGASRSELAGEVGRVVDGDSIHVRIGGRVEKVRYIGMNSPEVNHPTRGEEPGGRAAAALNRTLVSGQHVRLELDVQERDRHG